MEAKIKKQQGLTSSPSLWEENQTVGLFLCRICAENRPDPHTTFQQQLEAERGRGHCNDRPTILHGSRPVSPLFVFHSLSWTHTHTHSGTHTCVNPTGKSRVRFTLSLKINDTSNAADGCNQKFKQQAASLCLSLFFHPLSLFLSLLLLPSRAATVWLCKAGACVFHYLITI